MVSFPNEALLYASHIELFKALCSLRKHTVCFIRRLSLKILSAQNIDYKQSV